MRDWGERRVEFYMQPDSTLGENQWWLPDLNRVNHKDRKKWRTPGSIKMRWTFKQVCCPINSHHRVLEIAWRSGSLACGNRSWKTFLESGRKFRWKTRGRTSLKDPWNSCKMIDTDPDRNFWNGGARLDTNRTDFWRNQQNARYGIRTGLRENWQARYRTGRAWLVSVVVNMSGMLKPMDRTSMGVHHFFIYLFNDGQVPNDKLEFCSHKPIFLPCWTPDH